jgi:dTDP-4-amino-4,6-dideoxygalactose transaminase
LDGLVDKYTWQGLGSSFGLSDMLAAFLTAQLERSDMIRSQRRHVAAQYRSLLEPIASNLGVTLPPEPLGAEPADHMFYVLLPPGVRGGVIAAMRATGVQAAFHYVPLHSSAAGRRFSDGYRDCPVTDDISARLLRLPFFNSITDDEIQRSVEALKLALRAAA